MHGFARRFTRPLSCSPAARPRESCCVRADDAGAPARESRGWGSKRNAARCSVLVSGVHQRRTELSRDTKSPAEIALRVRMALDAAALRARSRSWGRKAQRKAARGFHCSPAAGRRSRAARAGGAGRVAGQIHHAGPQPRAVQR